MLPLYKTFHKPTRFINLIFFSILGAGLISPLPGCSKSPPLSLSVLTIDPLRSSINPRVIQYAGDFLIISSISSPFIELSPNEGWSFPFCASWQRLDDGKSVTCELMENLQWSDGSPMTAAEIVESLKESTHSSKISGVGKLVQQITLESPHRLKIEFSLGGPNALWALTGLDQVILDPLSREQIRKNGTLQLENGLQRSSGRFRLKSIGAGMAKLEPNPYFPIATSQAIHPVEIIGNLSIQEIESRLTKKSPGALAQILAGTIPSADLKVLRDGSLQVFNQPVRNALSIFIFGKHAMNSMSVKDRRYLFSEVAGKMLAARDTPGAPAIGFAPPSMLGALPQDRWKAMLTHAPLSSKKPMKIDLFVMKALKSSALYAAAKSALDGLPIQINEVVYDPSQPDSPEWKRRSSGDYDLLFGYEESYSAEPDPFWRDMRSLSASPKSFFSDAKLDEALLEPDLRKRSLLYQNFEQQCAEDPFVIPLQRFGNELFVTPGIEVAPQEAFGMMINLWAFKTAM